MELSQCSSRGRSCWLSQCNLSPCTGSSAPPSQLCHAQLQIQCNSGEGEEVTVALTPCLGRTLSPGLPVYIPVQGVGLQCGWAGKGPSRRPGGMSSSSPACCFCSQRTSTLGEDCLALMAQLPPALHVCDTPVPNTRAVPLHTAAEDVQCVSPWGTSLPLPVQDCL